MRFCLTPSGKCELDISHTLKIVLNSISSNKTRNFLTMLGILIGVFAIVLMVSIGEGVRLDVNKQIESLGSNIIFVTSGNPVQGSGTRRIGPQGMGGGFMGVTPLTNKDYNALLKIKGVKISPVISRSGVLKYSGLTESVQMTGSNYVYSEIASLPLLEGKYFGKRNEDTQEKVVIIGYKIYSEILNSNALNKTVYINDMPFKVIGVLKERGVSMMGNQDTEVYVPYRVMQNIANNENITTIYVSVRSQEEIDRVKKEIITLLKKVRGKENFRLTTQSQILEITGTIIGTLNLALGGIAAVSLLVGGIGIMNIMLVSVAERTREIGIRKAVGARRKDILAQFLLEAVFLSLAGGLLGLLMAYLGSLVLKNFSVPSAITSNSVMVAITFSTFIGVVFGVYPAYRAASLDPIVALRYE